MPGQRRLPLSPRSLGLLGCLAIAVVAYGAIDTIGRGRGTAGVHWRLAVTVGAGSSLGLIALLGAVIMVTRWRGMSRVLYLAWMGASGALGLITLVGFRVIGGGLPGSAWEVGLAAFMLPTACLALVLIPLLTWRRRPAGRGQARSDMRRQIVATITARRDGWSVRWTGLGRTPGTLNAPTLTEAADQAFTAVSSLPGCSVTELQLVIYPGSHRGGPAFDITADPGGLTATSARRPGETMQGGTLEDLVRTIDQTLADGRKGFRLRWTRPITATTVNSAVRSTKR